MTGKECGRRPQLADDEKVRRNLAQTFGDPTTDANYLQLRGWLPVAVLSDGTVIVWSRQGGESCPTDEALAHQANLDMEALED